MKNDIPLCVDLDGTLIATDTLHESFVKLLKQSPVQAISALFELKHSKARFKKRLAEQTRLDVATLPYNPDILDFIGRQKEHRQVVLVTGANTQIAEDVADHLDVFDESFGSTDSLNLTSKNKQEFLVSKYGEQGYDYIGNDDHDWPVWESARSSLVASRENKFLDKVRENCQPTQEFKSSSPGVRDWVRLLRVHQWSKNALIFVPFILEHRFSDFAGFFTALACFLAFSLLASFTYLVNDLLDIEADRANTTKSRRALAAGTIRIPEAVIAMGGLLLALFVLCLFLPGEFVFVMFVYFVTTTVYTFFFKKKIMLDVCALAILHTLRIVAGTVAIHAEWSFWLLAFSMFFFLSLALAKRVSELHNIKVEQKESPSSRGYIVSDINILSSAGISAGYISNLVIALYINSDKVSLMYTQPELLWLICPILLYWVGRIWIITSRGEMHEDPILFAIRDGTSLLTLAVIGLVFAAAIMMNASP